MSKEQGLMADLGELVHGEVTTETGKVLDLDIATSLIIPFELMIGCDNLEVVGKNRDNIYFSVIGSNSCIAHIEAGFCVLTDYIVDTVTGGNMALPKMLDSEHYGVYQVKSYNGHTTRDWIKNSCGNNRNIGQDIKYYIHGIYNAPKGYTLDHAGPTYDERERFKQYITNNINNGSHRYKKHISNEAALQQLIMSIRCEDRKYYSVF